MVYEYELRLVVVPNDVSQVFDILKHIVSYVPSLQPLDPHHNVYSYRVLYAKPHFRFRFGKLETKKIERQRAVYHDGLWFRWVESVETRYESWSMNTHHQFATMCFNFQNAFVVENRQEMLVDDRAKVYTFEEVGQGTLKRQGLVFEWELGEYSQPLNEKDIMIEDVLVQLEKYKTIYDMFRHHPLPPVYSHRPMVCSRKPVIPIDAVPKTVSHSHLLAHKYDGTFCLVHSGETCIKIKCEGNVTYIVHNESLGLDLVFAGERLKNGTVIILDVYQVRGIPVMKGCTRSVLTAFLPSLKLPPGFQIQKYVNSLEELGEPPEACDGVVVHDVVEDVIYKVKRLHTLDAVYFNGKFELSDGTTIPCSNDTKRRMKNGYVYEITLNGQVLRRRRDRFTGNTPQQIKRIQQAVLCKEVN